MRIVIALIFIMAPFSHAAELLTPDKLAIINNGMEYVMAGRWNDAMQEFDEYNKIDSTDPGRYLFRAMTLLSVMTDREENLFEEVLNIYLDSVKIKCKRILINCDSKDSAVCYLYLGHVHAYRSLYENRFGSSFAALREGLKAKGEYMRGLKADSTLYDIYLGLGSYHYWKTVKAGLLRTMGLFANERQKGIDEIHLAIDSSLFSSAPAKSALIWILLNEKQYDSAMDIAAEMYFKYPRANSFIWPIAKAFYEQEDYEKSAEYFEKLFERSKSFTGNYYNLIESGYWLFKSYAELGEKGPAFGVRSYIDTVYTEIPKGTLKKQRKKIYDMKHHRW